MMIIILITTRTTTIMMIIVIIMIMIIIMITKTHSNDNNNNDNDDKKIMIIMMIIENDNNDTDKNSDNDDKDNNNDNNDDDNKIPVDSHHKGPMMLSFDVTKRQLHTSYLKDVKKLQYNSPALQGKYNRSRQWSQTCVALRDWSHRWVTQITVVCMVHILITHLN